MRGRAGLTRSAQHSTAQHMTDQRRQRTASWACSGLAGRELLALSLSLSSTLSTSTGHAKPPRGAMTVVMTIPRRTRDIGT